jgi:hypothetical protein
MNLSTGERDGEVAFRQNGESGDRPLEAAHFRRNVVVEFEKARSVGEIDRASVRREVLGSGALEEGLRRLQLLVWLQRAVEGRHGDGGVASAQEPVGEIANSVDHASRPQRFSYWTKLGSASSSL